MRTSSRPRLLTGSALLLGAIVAVLAAEPARAGILNKYTGYTRPGNPPAPGPTPIKEGAPAAGPDKDAKAIGGTVYFAVFDRTKGTNGDPWGVGVKDFDKLFVSGADSDRTKLDTKA